MILGHPVKEYKEISCSMWEYGRRERFRIVKLNIGLGEKVKEKRIIVG